LNQPRRTLTAPFSLFQGRLTANLRRRVLPLLALLLTPVAVWAHNVGQSQTTKFFAPETVQMLADRATGVLPGGPGLRIGDIIYYIIESVPSPNGATLGSAGYITDYVPPGTQVVQASFVHKIPDPTKVGGFAYVDAPMGLPGMMPDGGGTQFNNTFGGSGGTMSAGSLARATQDTGIFFSTDPRTAKMAVSGAFNPQGLGVNSVVSNQWDIDQGSAFTNNTLQPVVFSRPSSNRGVTPVLDCALSGALCAPGSLFVGLGSVVAGPDAYYTNDYNPLLGGAGLVAAYTNVGPWHRISYPGSLLGGSGPVTAFGTPGAGARIIGTDTITGVPTAAGWSLSPANPLPYDPTLSGNPSAGPAVTPGLIGAHANAIRWAIGERAVGTVEHVKIGLKVTDLTLFGALTNPTHPAFTNVSDVFGGDASGSQKAIDSVWVYLAPSQANHNAQVNLIKQVVATSTTANGPWVASDGAFLVKGQFVKYRINYLNANAAPLYNVVITDTIDTVNTTYAVGSATTGNPFIGTATFLTPTVTWPAIPVLSPGGGGYVELVVQIKAAAAGLTTANASNLTSNEILAPGASSLAVSALSASGLPPNFVVTKTVNTGAASPNQAAPGGPATYTITIENHGGALAFPLLGGGTPVHPKGGGVAPNPWLVVGDQLPLNGVAAGMTAGAATITLTDLATGVIYPMALTTNYTVPATGRVGAVFYSINTYPVGHSKAGLAFDFVDCRLTITLPTTVSATMLPGVYFNQVELFYGLDQTLFAGGFGAGSDGSKTYPNLAPISVNAPDFSNLPLTATDLSGGVPAPGDTIRYTLTMLNTGVAAGTNPTVVFPVPVNAPFVVGSLVAPGANIAYDNGTGLYTYVPGAGPTDANVKFIRLIYPSIAAGASVVPTFDVQIPPTAGDGVLLSCQAVATSVETGVTNFLSDDPAQSGLLDPTYTTVVARPDFSTSSKSVLVNGASGTLIHAGDTLTYTIVVTDTGNNPAGSTNVTVADTVDLTKLENIVLGSAPVGWVVSGPDGSGQITWYTLAMTQGASASLSFTAQVKTGLPNGTTVDNVAVVSCSETTSTNLTAPTLTIPVTQVSGSLFDDTNGNGIQDGGETGIANVAIALRVPGFVTDIVTVFTDATGAYVLTAPLAGNWDVVVSDTGGLLTGWSLTTANQPLNVTINNGQVIAGQNFGYQLTTPPATIRGRIFDDQDASGLQNGAEAGLAGVSLSLHNGSGALVGAATTNILGDFQFANLAAGNYTLTISDSSGLLVNRYLTTATPSPVSIVGLSAGATVVTDFGYRLGSTIGDVVFDDADASGTYTAGDSGVYGVTVELRPSGGGAGTAIATITTDAFGAYRFQGISPGNYDVVVTDTAGVLTPFTPVTPATLAVTAASGIDQLGIDFPFSAVPAITVGKTVDKGVVGFNEAVHYTITVTNTGGTARSFSLKDVLPTTAAALPYTASSCNFQYISTDSVTLNGSPFTVPSVPTLFSYTPTWSGFDLPAASTLVIAFTAFSGANTGLNYNGVQISYAPTGVPPLTLLDFPNLAVVSVSDLGNVSLAVTAVNGVPVPSGATPTVVGNDVVTYRMTLSNTAAALAQTVQTISATLPVGFTLQAGSSTLTSSNYPAGIALTGSQVGQLVNWALPGTLPMTAAAYPDTLWLDFNQVVPSGVSGTFTTKGVMGIGAVAPGINIDTGNAAPVEVKLYQVGDLVYKDVNGNGAYDAGTDQPAVGVTLELRPQGGGSGSALASTTTNASGNYSLQIANPGTYSVVVTDTGGILLGHTSTTGGPVQNATVGGGTLSVLSLDFGYQPPALAATIDGAVFDDTSGNGIKDGAEVGIAGVTVEIRNLFNTPIATVTTNASGLYSFTGIPGGMYQVLVTTAPSGRTATTAQPLSITVADGATSTGNDLGYQLPGTVTGRVFADIDNSGSFNAGDAWLSGATVWLKDGATTIATATTDASGVYTFDTIPMAGGASRNLSVDIDNLGGVIAGATLTTGTDPTAVTAVSGSTVNAGDVGYWIQGSIAGTVYDDLNGSAAFDGTPTDGVLSGVTVNLLQGAVVVATTTTDTNGGYQFAGRAAGGYTVQVVTPSGYNATAPAVVAPAVDPEIAVTLTAGQALAGQDFGFVVPPHFVVTKTTPLPSYLRSTAAPYTLTITNTGGVATNVVIADFLPSNAAYAAWTDLVAPSLSAAAVTYTANSATVTLNGVATTKSETYAAPLITWQQVVGVNGGYTLNTGDSLVFTYSPILGNTEGTYFNSLKITYGTATTTTLWYPDLNSVMANRRYSTDKTVVAVNGAPWAVGIPNLNIGDTVTYEVSLTALAATSVCAASVADTLPVGLAYVPNSTQIMPPGGGVLTPYTDAALATVLTTTPGSTTTSELLTYTFFVGNTPVVLPVAPALCTAAVTNAVSTMRFDAQVTSALFTGNRDNLMNIAAERIGGRVPLAKVVVGATINILPPATINGTVYDDSNGNGIKEGGETGLSGVTVELQDGLGTALASAVSDGAGLYSFTGIGGGSYQLVIPIPPGGRIVTSTQPLAVVVTSGATSSGNNVGLHVPGVVSGRIFTDLDSSGSFTVGDAWLPGATVWLKEGALTIDTAVTDTNGTYTFNVAMGGAVSRTLTVDIDNAGPPIAGATQTTGSDPSAPFPITSGATVNLGDVGYVVQAGIAGTVYNDLNGNNAFDGTPTDGAFSGVTVNLLQGAAVVATTTSDSSGMYSFTNLGAGSFSVQAMTPAGGYAAIAPTLVPPATQPEIAVVLAGGQQAINQNFGFSQPPNLTVTKTTAAPFAARSSTAVYTLTITNSGGPASNVVVSDYLPNTVVAAGWPVAPAAQPTPSPAAFVFPAVVAPQVTTATLNGAPVVFTETPGVGTVVWSTAAGGFTLGNGDTLSITFAADTPNTEGSYYNSASVAYLYGGGTASTLWLPDANLLNVTRTFGIGKQVVAVNGVAWSGGIPTIDVGDTVTYEVTVTNFRGTGRLNRDELFVATLSDTLPLGFKYVLGTSQTVSPGNNVLALTPILDPVVTPATAATSEVMAYTFNGGVIPNRGALPIIGDSMVTGPSYGDTATLRFDAVAIDAVTPNQPLSGNHNNSVTAMADRLGNAGVTLSYLGATVNVSTRAKVQGTIFKNLDGNGTYNPPTDTPLNGVTIELQPSGGGAAIATTSDATGAYTLIAPAGGTYTVVVTDSGDILTGLSNAVAPALPITLLDGQTLTAQDWGYAITGTPGTISGTIFDDLNADGIMQGGEAGLTGAVVQLQSTGGVVLATATTLAGGAYSFPNLAAGNYVVTVDRTSLPTRYSTPAGAPVDPASVTVTGGVTSTQNLGWAVGATFSGFVFEDADNNGLRGAVAPNLEPGRSGVTLQLVDTATSTVMETVTTATKPVAPATIPALGSYAFAAVPAGTYRIDVTDTAGRLTGYALTTTNQPMTPAVVAAGAATATDFGYFLAPALTVTKTMASTALDRGSKMDATITVTNTGGGVANLSVADVLPALAPASPFGGVGLFTASVVPYVFDATVSVSLDGVPLTAGVDYTVPVALSATPTWGGIALPGGSTLEIHLTAAQPAAAQLTGSPNFNGAAIQYGATPVVVDYPDLVVFSTARDVTFVKRLVAVNGVAPTGTPVIHPGDTVTFELAVGNSINPRANTVTSFGDVTPADVLGAGLTYVLGTSKLTNPALGTVLAPIADPVVTPGVVGTGISQAMGWTVAATTLPTYPSEVVLRYDTLVAANTTPDSYANLGSGTGSNVRGAFTLYGTVNFDVSSAAPLLAVVKTADVAVANPGATVNFTATVSNVGAGPATSVVASLVLDPFVGFVVGSLTFTDGPVLTPAQGASGLTLGAVTYFDGAGTPITPTGAPGAIDPAIRAIQVNMTGSMNGGVVPIPAFALIYQGVVQ